MRLSLCAVYADAQWEAASDGWDVLLAVPGGAQQCPEVGEVSYPEESGWGLLPLGVEI